MEATAEGDSVAGAAVAGAAAVDDDDGDDDDVTKSCFSLVGFAAENLKKEKGGWKNFPPNKEAVTNDRILLG